MLFRSTRADFGKLKSLIRISFDNQNFDVRIFATGMHLQDKYGYTLHEIEKSGFSNIHSYSNHTVGGAMDVMMAETIKGLSDYVRDEQPDMIVVHGDRIEALAGAIVGALNNILVAHIEGGEVSGTVDELIRHAVSKMSHLHFVANDQARMRLIQMGERDDSIFIIGSPDMDVMVSNKLPPISEVKSYYNIEFDRFALLMMHPVTTEASEMKRAAESLFGAASSSGLNFVVIYPNNDLGTDAILEVIHSYDGNPRFKIYPSIRFEYFLVLLKQSELIIGNSSAGVREAPFYGVPTVNIGTRQHRRALNEE